MDKEEILQTFKERYNQKNIDKMKRFGVDVSTACGIYTYLIRDMARAIGKNTPLAIELWDCGIHEGKILASLIADPENFTEEDLERWVKQIYSWDVCDQACTNLFQKTRFFHKKLVEWTQREEEYVKRAGFVLVSKYGYADKNPDDEIVTELFSLIKKGSTDERYHIKKAVNWALRQLGKKNLKMNALAIQCAEEILLEYPDSKSARWVAHNAWAELLSKPIQDRLKTK